MNSIAFDLATWASELKPSELDRALAQRSLLDTLAVTLAARGHPLETVVADLDEPTRWAALGHVLDFDDLHMTSTAHISVVCVMATLAAGGDARAYLGGAGVMARLGTALGWSHYASGWHATCTAGAPAAAVAAAISLGLSRDEIARAIALAVPAAGGVQRAFGTDAKSLQVGFAAAAGVRAARLVAAGATADVRALDEWFDLMGGDRSALDLRGAAVPDGLAIKIFPCCYALQRPIAAMRELMSEDSETGDVEDIRVVTPESALQPLIHHSPKTALEGKFSIEYAIAATLLDNYPGFASFTDDAVQRARAQELIPRIELVSEPFGDSLLSGEVAIEIRHANGKTTSRHLATPPGAPTRPPDDEMFRAKLVDCGPDVTALLSGINWTTAAGMLRSELHGRSAAQGNSAGGPSLRHE